jgi:hypothetical protein
MRAKVYQPCWYPLQGRGSEDWVGTAIGYAVIMSLAWCMVETRANTHHRANIALL